MEGKRLSDIKPIRRTVVAAPVEIPVHRVFAASQRHDVLSVKNAAPDHSQDRLEWYNEKQPSLVKFRGYPENIARHSTRLKSKKRQIATRKIYAFTSFLVALSILFMNILPVSALVGSAQANISDRAKSGIAELKLAEELVKQQQFKEAGVHFDRATSQFEQAKLVIFEAGQGSEITSLFAQHDQIYTASGLLVAATDITRSGSILMTIAENISNAAKINNETNASTESNPMSKVSVVLSGIMESNNNNIQQSQKIVELLTDAQSQVDLYAKTPSTEPTLEKTRLQLVEQLPTLLHQAKSLNNLLTELPLLLGKDNTKKYLVLFQNNSELRPSGGFLGSFATMSIKNGNINSFAVETNIYKLDNTYAKMYHIDPPAQIGLMTKDWLMRDSNWSVDFDTAAKQVAWFYNQETGINVDGVLAIDTSLISSMLDVVGSVTIPKDNITVNKDNFNAVTTQAVEKDYWQNSANKQANEPKSILADMVPILLQSMFKQMSTDPGKIAQVFYDAAMEKHLLFDPLFITNKDTKAQLSLINPLPKNDDFLMVNNANLGGLKSSLNINQTVAVTIKPTSHNTILHSVEITRTHTGNGVWPDTDNHNYLRLVVPDNATLVKSETNGVEGVAPNEGTTTQKFDNYQTFGLWVTTAVKATTVTKFEYEMPIVKDKNGVNTAQFSYVKQPGTIGDKLKLNLVNANGLTFQNIQTNFELYTKTNWQTAMVLK
ncbi:MAG: DUF4012 domain-containing protein [Patescibacteria group bacterium]|jgi:hypothetical protein